MEKNENKIISSILERLDKIEAEISQIKDALSLPKVSIKTQPAEPPPIRPIEKKKEKPVLDKGPKVSLESAIGTKWLGRVGMVAIIFGIAFFLKYSFDNRLIGETGRIILGIFWGICFIGTGEYFQRKKNWNIYGQILTGGGLAILYFSIYAAFAFYHLITQIPAFAALVIITTTGITLSVRYSALSIAVIGILGGFLTPIMLSTGENRPISLFSYILLLDSGIISIVYYKRWRSIGIASLIGTILMYTAWHERFYTLDQQPIAFGIVTIFFIFYNLYVLFSNLKQKASITDQAVIVLTAAFFFLSFDTQNQFINNWNLKSFVIALSCIEILFAIFSLRLFSDKKNIIYSFAGASVVVNIIAIFIIFEKEWISAALAAEMVIFAYIGIRLNKFPLRLISYILGALSVVRFFEELNLSLGPFDKFTLILNTRFFICSFIIAAFYALMVLMTKNRDELTKNESLIIPGTLITTQALSVVLLSIEFYDFYRFPALDIYFAFVDFRYARQLSLSIVWAIYASALIGIGIVKKIRILRVLGIILVGVTTVKVFFFDLSELKTIYRIVSFVILGLLLLAVSYLYNRFKHRIFGED